VFETPEKIEVSMQPWWNLRLGGPLHYSSWACSILVPGPEMFEIDVGQRPAGDALLEGLLGVVQLSLGEHVEDDQQTHEGQ